MIKPLLKPNLEILRKEYVLVQAWKKSVNYIRYHNWYADTLELDFITVNLPKFLFKLSKRLESPEEWRSNDLRVVFAPKSQNWYLSKDLEIWQPSDKSSTSMKNLRPLAHVNIEDQVVATALMLCLADRVEAIQGDPRTSIDNLSNRKKVISYGNRLFCDVVNNELTHPWGSAKLYRAYYQDYKQYLFRSNHVAMKIKEKDGNNARKIFIVRSDIKQFYDHVRPDQLNEKIQTVMGDEYDLGFVCLLKRVLNWSWHENDRQAINKYMEDSSIPNFDEIALPQGLVASGFFANIFLIEFDNKLKQCFGSEIIDGLFCHDACRYVDDLCLTITTDRQCRKEDVCTKVSKWLNRLLSENAPGVNISEDKTKIIDVHEEYITLHQSIKMNRVQGTMSGGFGASEGLEILDSLQNLFMIQESLNIDRSKIDWQFTHQSDVRDTTVERFVATRFRSVCRSVRPLLDDLGFSDMINFKKVQSNLDLIQPTQHELDESIQIFASKLIERWITDPSNVRLLRIGLDLWPNYNVLFAVSSQLLSKIKPEATRKLCNYEKRVACYCLSEILRASVTETGFVKDIECLPNGVNLEEYRQSAYEIALKVLELSSRYVPWYLRQQALLVVATASKNLPLNFKFSRHRELNHYNIVIKYVQGEPLTLTNIDFAKVAVLAQQVFLSEDNSIDILHNQLTRNRLIEIIRLDPSYGYRIVNHVIGAKYIYNLPSDVRANICIDRQIVDVKPKHKYLADYVINSGTKCSLRNELSLLKFAKAFLVVLLEEPKINLPITPGKVQILIEDDAGIADIKNLHIDKINTSVHKSLYSPPSWCRKSEQWRFQLGFLLRFILTGQIDFTMPVRVPSWKKNESIYRPAKSHWYQRIYGFFNGRTAFGNDWLPITEWLENLLHELLRWPGTKTTVHNNRVSGGIETVIELVEQRIGELENLRGKVTNTLLLPLKTTAPTKLNSSRPLRACVIQTVIPKFKDFNVSDLELSNSEIRSEHRNHLSMALATVKSSLNLRTTYMEHGSPYESMDTKLDWLILPELAVHPEDVKTHLIPFSMAYKTIILAGLTYHRISSDSAGLWNSAIWIIPEHTEDNGMQIRIVKQGKANLSSEEQIFEASGANIQGFRPAQWLVQYPWCGTSSDSPLYLTASICYDATDIGIISDVKNNSHVLAIPALNRDVKTFDHLAMALHYHMYQLVVVVNNGEFGGSSAYWPVHGEHHRQLFHLQGQPQASVAFFNIENISNYLERYTHGSTQETKQQEESGNPSWKFPPANTEGPNNSNQGS